MPLVEGKERKPTVVIVHGANHQPAHFEKLIKHIEDAGYKVRAPPLPSCHKKRAAKDLAPDIEAVQTVIEDEISMHNDIVLVAHSYGGIPASSAVRRLDKVSKARQHNKAGVSRVIYLAAMIPNKDESMMDRRPKEESEAVASGTVAVENGFWTPTREEVEKRWYNRQSKEDVEWAYNLIKPWSVATGQDGMKWEPWKWEVPCTYVWCTDDRVMSNELQEELTKGRGMDVIKIDADHSPFLDQSEYLSKVVRKYAGEAELDIGEVYKS